MVWLQRTTWRPFLWNEIHRIKAIIYISKSVKDRCPWESAHTDRRRDRYCFCKQKARKRNMEVGPHWLLPSTDENLNGRIKVEKNIPAPPLFIFCQMARVLRMSFESVFSPLVPFICLPASMRAMCSTTLLGEKNSVEHMACLICVTAVNPAGGLQRPSQV